MARFNRGLDHWLSRVITLEVAEAAALQRGQESQVRIYEALDQPVVRTSERVTVCLNRLRKGRQTDEVGRDIVLPFIVISIPPLTGVCLSGFPWEFGSRRSRSEITKTGPVGLANVGPYLLQLGSWHGVQRDSGTRRGSASHETPAAPSAGSRRQRGPAAERRLEKI